MVEFLSSPVKISDAYLTMHHIFNVFISRNLQNYCQKFLSYGMQLFIPYNLMHLEVEETTA